MNSRMEGIDKNRNEYRSISVVIVCVLLCNLATRSAAQGSANGSTGCTLSFGSDSLLFQKCQTLGGGYSLSWNVISDSSVTVRFSGVHSGWIAFGISSSFGQMVSASAIVGFPSMDQGVTVDNYFLGGKSSNAVKPPGKLAASSLKGEYISGEVRLLFTLNLTAAEMNSVNIIWAKGSHNAANGLLLSEHNDGDSFWGTVSFELGEATTASQSNLKNVHGLLNVVAWGFLIPLGAILARYAKGYDPAWFYAHVSVQGLGYLLGIAGFATGSVSAHRSGSEHSTHQALAVLILVLSSLQVVGSFVRPKKDAKHRLKWNFCHHWSGRLVIILSVANIFIGLGILEPESGWVIAYSIILGLLVAAAVALEARKVMCSRKGDCELGPNVEEGGRTTVENKLAA